MGRIAVIVVVAAALGGFGGLALLEAFADERVLTIGNVQIPATVEPRIYDREQVLLAAFGGATAASLVAVVLSMAFEGRKRRR